MKHQTVSIILSFIFLTCTAGFAMASLQDKARDQALLEAVAQGDQKKVLELLRQGANVNARGINDTALETAIFQQDVETARLLLDHGAHIEPGDLAEAAHGAQGDRSKAGQIVLLLLDKRADLKACTEWVGPNNLRPGGHAPQPGTRCTVTAGENALKEAALSRNVDIVRLLLAKGVPVSGRDWLGNSVLMEVVRIDALAEVQVLLEAGADAKATNNSAETVLMRAALADRRSDPSVRVNLLKALLARGADVLAKDNTGQTALHYATRQVMSESGGFLARAEIVQLLIENGARVNAQDTHGESPLMAFVQRWEAPLEIAQLLLEKGADVNLRDQIGATALMLAAGKGRSDLAKLLLDHGAPIDAKDELHRTAVVHGVEAGQAEVVTLLVRKGADLSLTEWKNAAQLQAAVRNFALVKAATLGNTNDARLLLESGADVNAKNRNGDSALLLAVQWGDRNGIVELLVNKGADVDATDLQGNTALMMASSRNSQETVKLLLDHKAAVNAVNIARESALLVTAAGGHTQIAALLLAAGADVRARNRDERTALHVACKDDLAQSELVELLLSKGADANASDKDGNTALMVAVRGGAWQVIAPLVKGGADVNAKDPNGRTALRLAKESKEPWATQEWGARQRDQVFKMLAKADAKE